MEKQVLSEDYIRPLPTLKSALKVPLEKSGFQALASAWCLVAAEIFPLAGRFLARHELDFTAARLQLEPNREFYLLHLSAKAGNCQIPAFILVYIKDLPLCHVFQSFSAPDKDLIFLCEYGFSHPLALAEIISAAPEAGLYLSFGRDRGRNSIVKPLPRMHSSTAIMRYEADFAISEYNLPATAEPGKLSIPLRFVEAVPDAGKPAEALLLEGPEISWLRGLLYRLPSPLFAKIEWIGNDEHLFLFFAEAADISFIPFGRAFKRLTDNIFIPADKDIIPTIEPQLLEDIFAVDHRNYVFVTDSWRRDLPRPARSPLSRLLTVDNDIKVEFTPDLNPVDFIWDNPVFIDDDRHPEPEPDDSAEFEPVIPAGAGLEKTVIASPEAGAENSSVITENLNEYAALLLRRGDLLGAATLFFLAHNHPAAADCYAAAARELEQSVKA